MTDRARRLSTCLNSGVRMLRALTMLCLGLTSVGGWQMTALPVPSGHAHCASSQASARQAVALRMRSYDHLSSEFQARRRHPRHAGQSNPAATYRCPLAVAEAGEPAHGHGVWRAPLVAAAAQGRERVGAALQRRPEERGRVRSHAHACRTPTRVLSKPAHSAHWLGLGRYTLQGRQAPEKDRGTYVLAFEQHEEACRFGMMLQAKRALSLALSLSLSLCNPRFDVTGAGARVRPGDGDEVDVGAAG